ncbi:MAG: insulinase family protein [Bacteroidota bacterium]
MKKSKFIMNAVVALFLLFGVSNIYAQKQYAFKTFENDPLKTRIYTLDNGLTIYTSVYKNAPRIQTYIAVKAGSKNDPHETTGLAHYFEHMMFKGTSHFGSLDYAKESVMIAKIDSLFEIYRVTKDSARRDFLYHNIDSISFAASKLAIPNEYDKMMSIIGATGTNAFTSLEQTVYVEDVPSNQLENWLAIESERFSSPVLRLFHTELETIYEEKNMTLTNDNRKVYDALLSGLFQKHPYGTQTTIGDAEHLRNPSMKNIREYFAKYYVPNNMAICLSGDFDPDQAVALIDKYWGKIKSSPVPEFTFEPETPITAPIIKEVLGPDAENITLSYRFDGANSDDAKYISMIDMILSNSAAGLIDLNLNQKQKVLNATSYSMIQKDYSAEVLTGKAKTGQSLDEVRDLLLAQIELIKKGDFPDWLTSAIVNDLKLKQMKSYEDNSNRGMAYVESFTVGSSWDKEVTKYDEMAKLTKQQIVEFANKHFGNNYVLVYKKTGKDKTVHKVKKPKITKIQINRDMSSDFLKKIEANKVPDIEPVFIDYSRDMKKLTMKNNISVLYKENIDNKTFDLYYVFNMGSDNDKKLPLAIDYLKYLGTSKFTPEALKQEFYKLGVSMDVSASNDRVYVSLSGLSETMDKSLELFESLLTDPQPNKEALDNLVNDKLKKRTDAKLNPQNIFSSIVMYGIYGPKSPNKNILSETELKAVTPEELISRIKELNSFEHKVLYYGSETTDNVVNILNKQHNVPAQFKPIPAPVVFTEAPIEKSQVYFVNYDMKQAQLLMLSKSQVYNKDSEPIVTLFNEYFGGSMNSIVFQELREARSLAYTAVGFYQNMLRKKESHYYNLSYIQTQTDKLNDAMTAFYELMDNMPLAQKNFDLAKNAIVQKLRTERVTKSDVLFSYLDDLKMGIDYDIRKDIFTKVATFTLDDVKKFEEQYIKAQPKNIMVMGDKATIDFKGLKKYGKVTDLTMTDIFGY